jgi:MFS family permease
MPHSIPLNSRLTRRLLPLYAAAFLESCVFWYSTEKLFMGTIGFTATTIGVMASAYSIAMLLVETPSGLIADRWSRKGMLIIASFLLALSSLIEGLSQSVPVYIFGAVIWGLFMALYSGTYDPIVYDTLTEEAGHTNGFKRYFGFIKVLDGLGLAVGSIAGAAMAAAFGFRLSFFITIPVALLAAVCLIFFKEPTLHKAQSSGPIVAHIRAMARAALHRSSLLGMLLILVLGAILVETIFEYTQLWLIATATPVLWFGIFTAIVLGTISLSGLLAPHLRLNDRKFVAFFTTILLISGLTLVTSHTNWVLVATQSVIVVGMLSTGIVYLERLHDRLPSNVRSGASSAVSSLTRLIFIGVAILFGSFAEHHSIFSAGWLITVPLIVICAFLYLEARSAYRDDPADYPVQINPIIPH